MEAPQWLQVQASSGTSMKMSCTDRGRVSCIGLRQPFIMAAAFSESLVLALRMACHDVNSKILQHVVACSSM
jgi:hypothetical protein